MKANEKSIVKMKFGLCIQSIIEVNKLKAKENKRNGVKDHRLVTSLRKLAAAADVEFSIIQKIASGNKNPELTTIVSIAEGLGISEASLFAYYSIIHESEVKKRLAKGDQRTNES